MHCSWNLIPGTRVRSAPLKGCMHAAMHTGSRIGLHQEGRVFLKRPMHCLIVIG